MPNVKRPLKDDLERGLRTGMSAEELAVKYKVKKLTVYNWIRSYGLQGIKGVKKPKGEITTPSGIDVTKVEDLCTKAESGERYEFAILSNEHAKALRDNTGEPKSDGDKAPGCFSEYNPKIYWCNDCEDKAECQTTFNKLKQAHGPQPLNEGKAQFDLSKAENIMDAVDERWLRVRDALVDIRRSDIEQVELSFREKLRGLLADVVGEI